MSPRSHSARRSPSSSPSPVPFEHVSLGAAAPVPCCRAAENFCRKFARISCFPLHSALLNLAASASALSPSLDRHIFLGMMERWTREKKRNWFRHCNRFIKTKWVCVYVVSLSHSLHESGPCSMSASLSSRFMQSSSSPSVTHSLTPSDVGPVLPWPISHE